MCVRVQSCLNFCSPMDCSLPASSAHGIFQARILEWGAFHLSGDFPKSGIKPVSLESPALAGRFFFFFTTSTTWDAERGCYGCMDCDLNIDLQVAGKNCTTESLDKIHI